MIEQLAVTLVITLLAGCIGLYIRDGQNDHLSAVKIGKKMHYTSAGLCFIFVMVILNTMFVLK